MMALATEAELEAYLQQDIANPTASLALSIASALFELESRTKFVSTASTYQVEGRGQPAIVLPRGPVISVDAVRVAGVALVVNVDYTVVMASLYRITGWGTTWGSTVATAPYIGIPPQLVEVDYHYGYTSTPDDVKGAVLETAGAICTSPDIATMSESIDDYSISSFKDAGGVQLSPAAMAIAIEYRSGGFA
jgi:hypothetical protein